MAAKPAVKKRRGDVKEDIAALQFGDDFSPDAGVEALLNAEVKMILETTMSTNSASLDEQSEMMQNSVLYCQSGPGRFHDVDSVTNCKNELMNKTVTGETLEVGRWGGQNLVSFEAAALGNLQPSNAEEAISLIRSLSRFQPAEVEEMCQIVQRFKAANM